LWIEDPPPVAVLRGTRTRHQRMGQFVSCRYPLFYGDCPKYVPFTGIWNRWPQSRRGRKGTVCFPESL